MPLPAKIYAGGYEALADADIVVLSACSTIFEQDRLLELDATVKVIAEIAPQLTASGFSGIVVSISNPCDVIAQYFARITGLNVVGTGTALDSARLCRRLAAMLGVSPHSVCAYELGEHGDSQVPVWSSATVAGEPVDAFYQSQKGRDLDHAGIAERTKNAGGTVIKLKGATFYGVAMSTSRIVEAICEDENSVLPVAHVLGEKFGPLQNVAISLPCVINREGIARVVRPVMNEAETQALTRSAETLRTFMDQALTE